MKDDSTVFLVDIHLVLCFIIVDNILGILDILYISRCFEIADIISVLLLSSPVLCTNDLVDKCCCLLFDVPLPYYNTQLLKCSMKGALLLCIDFVDCPQITFVI